MPAEGDPMKLYIFKSGASAELRAFADDLRGDRLPGQFGPWEVIGAVAAGNAPPHGFKRDQIEKSISEQGFQLWRLKPKKPT
jgi:hypothetical protein